MDEASRYVKNPGDILDYILDLSLFLGDDTIFSAEVSSSDGVTVDSLEVNPVTFSINNLLNIEAKKAVVVWLSGGNPGSQGRVVIRVNTDEGRQKDISYPVTISNPNR